MKMQARDNLVKWAAGGGMPVPSPTAALMFVPQWESVPSLLARTITRDVGRGVLFTQPTARATCCLCPRHKGAALLLPARGGLASCAEP